MSHFYGMRYPQKTMQEYKEKGWAIEATMGGLVLGRSHDEGGIFIWVKRGEYYVLEAEMEGYEYILNLGATHYYKSLTSRFHQYDAHKHIKVEEKEPPSHIMVLDTRHPVEPKYLLFDTGGFSVINKYSTSGYLETLDQINKAVTFEAIGNDQAKLVHNSHEKIEVCIIRYIVGHESGVDWAKPFAIFSLAGNNRKVRPGLRFGCSADLQSSAKQAWLATPVEWPGFLRNPQEVKFFEHIEGYIQA